MTESSENASAAEGSCIQDDPQFGQRSGSRAHRMRGKLTAVRHSLQRKKTVRISSRSNFMSLTRFRTIVLISWDIRSRDPTRPRGRNKNAARMGSNLIPCYAFPCCSIIPGAFVLRKAALLAACRFRSLMQMRFSMSMTFCLLWRMAGSYWLGIRSIEVLPRSRWADRVHREVVVFRVLGAPTRGLGP